MPATETDVEKTTTHKTCMHQINKWLDKRTAVLRLDSLRIDHRKRDRQISRGLVNTVGDSHAGAADRLAIQDSHSLEESTTGGGACAKDAGVVTAQRAIATARTDNHKSSQSSGSISAALQAPQYGRVYHATLSSFSVSIDCAAILFVVGVAAGQRNKRQRSGYHGRFLGALASCGITSPARKPGQHLCDFQGSEIARDVLDRVAADLQRRV